ncbi:MAG: ABC transporter permease [Saprospiraceae bacterium]|nr:ABC transporter permease [Saprospiraceae bacterium]
MLKNYLTIALRNLDKNRLYSGLNLFGLAIGLAACLLILVFIANELSYDRWNPLLDRIVRPTVNLNFGGTQQHFAVSGSTVGPDCGSELSDVQSWCRMRDYGTYLVRREGQGHQNIKEERVLTVDSCFFELFPLKILSGDARSALNRPKTLALSRSTAEKYFGTVQMAMGQNLLLENEEIRMVSAVFEDMPANSHFRADLLLAMNGNEEVKNEMKVWGASNNFHTYLLLHKGVDPHAFDQKFATLAKGKLEATIQGLLGSTMTDFEKTGQFVRMELQPMADIHLHSDLSVELSANGSMSYVWIFGAIAGFILLIACINFMNLATARAAMRAREVGMRKALGGSRGSLIGQFLSESVLLTVVSVALALGISTLAMPWFRNLTGQSLHMPWAQPMFWMGLGAGTLLVGLLAGSYPAFFLSRFEAVRVLKGQVIGSSRGGGLRSALVVFQFAVSVALITATMLIYNQLNYIQNKKLGFDKSQLLILEDAYAIGDRIYNLKDEMLRNPAVESATVSGFLPVPSNRSDQGFSKKRAFDTENAFDMQRWRVDSDYFKTIGIELAEGRFFDPTRLTDSSAILLNETAVKQFRLTDPIGQKLYTLDRFEGAGMPRPEDFIELEVIGVVRDFHWESLRDNIGPMCFQLGKSRGLATFRFQGEQASTVLTALETQWKNMAPDQPFNYTFLDQAFNRMYATEMRLGKIAGIFTGMALLVSCLGLFGLAAFTIEQRKKEIGIRKVLGATVSGVTGMLAKDFLKLVLLGVVIAVPAAWYFMNEWLSDFAYRIQVQPWIFLLSGVGAVLIAFLTVSFQSIKAALANPVNSLKNE